MLRRFFKQLTQVPIDFEVLCGLFWLQLLLFLVYRYLLSLYVLKHVLCLLKHHIVWKYFWKFIIERKYFLESWKTLLHGVGPLEKFRNIIKDEVVLKGTDNVSLVIVNDVIDDLDVVVVHALDVFLLQYSSRLFVRRHYFVETEYTIGLATQ